MTPRDTNSNIYPSYFKLLMCWLRSFPQSHSYLCSWGLMRGSCLSPEASLRLVKFVPDEFVTPLPPLSNSNYLGYRPEKDIIS
ncbi:hypothetical protein CDA56_26635 [Klebsiella michiganensis]|nr:hypothetical protein CDA56_26635 [Klebsiella michiganensis]